MKIGWYCGKDDWAFKHLTEHLVSEMDDMHHENNKTGDVQIFYARRANVQKIKR